MKDSTAPEPTLITPAIALKSSTCWAVCRARSVLLVVEGADAAFVLEGTFRQPPLRLHGSVSKGGSGDSMRTVEQQQTNTSLPCWKKHTLDNMCATALVPTGC